jgi:hypothetical protein
MSVLYSITKDAEFEGASVIFADGSTYPVANDHPNYAEIIAFLLAGTDDDEKLLNLVNPFDAIYRSLVKLSERVSRKGTTIYLDGDPVDSALTKHIVRILDAGDDKDDSWKAYVAFLEKLATNPSKVSQKHLYHYIESHNITIHPDGDIILWKGTDANGKSKHAGYGIVDGKEIVNDFLPNKVGSTVEIPRSRVDDNRNRHCSSGLHAGTFDYASGFKGSDGILFTVKVNPRDVVSVPSDYNNAKVRISRYVVIGKNLPDVDSPLWTEPVKTKAPKAEKPIFYPASKVDEFKATILGLQAQGINPVTYGNKRVTSARRPEWRQALTEMGISF